MSVGKEFALLFGVLFLPGMLAQGGDVDPQSFESIRYQIQLLAVAIPQILLVVTFSDLRRPGSSRRFGWRRPDRGDLISAFVGITGVLAVVWAVSILAGIITSGGEGTEPVIDWSFERWELIPLVLVSTMAIGYREEIFYRAYITDRAEEAGVDPRFALAGGALLFAAGHVYQGVMGFVIALAIGLLLGAVYLKGRSLHGIAVAHGLYNFLVLLGSASA